MPTSEKIVTDFVEKAVLKPATFRLPYDGLNTAFSEVSGLSCPYDSSLTHQSFKDECDVNKIIENLDASGFLSERAARPYPPEFDASEVPDYHEAMNQVAYANQAFMALPAHVREEFAHDPARFVKYASDPANAEGMLKLGLATPRVPQTPSAAVTPVSGGNNASPSEGGEA